MASAGNVDDLTLEFSDGPPEYWQIKASVDASTPLTEDWLLEKTKASLSLLQRLHASWVNLNREDMRPRIVLATTKAIDPADPVLSYRATIDCRLADTMRVPTFAAARRRWAAHLGLPEADLLAFLGCLEIHHGQSEREWRSKVLDAAHGAGVQRSDGANALGIQQVRDWIKRPRTTLTPSTIAGVLRSLGIFDTGTRRLFVAQGLEYNPRAGSATYITDWVNLFKGDDARTRRVFKDPSSAQIVRADLAQARHRFRAAGLTDIEIDGPVRLPLWFTVGSELMRTAGFTVSTRANKEIWSSDAAPCNDSGITLAFADDSVAQTPGLPLVVSVSVCLDIQPDVLSYAAHGLPDATLLQATMESPNSLAVRDQEHAVGIAVSIRDELRRLRRDLAPPEIHLFLARSRGALPRSSVGSDAAHYCVLGPRTAWGLPTGVLHRELRLPHGRSNEAIGRPRSSVDLMGRGGDYRMPMVFLPPPRPWLADPIRVRMAVPIARSLVLIGPGELLRLAVEGDGLVEIGDVPTV